MANDFKQKFYDITVLIQQEFDRNLEFTAIRFSAAKDAANAVRRYSALQSLMLTLSPDTSGHCPQFSAKS